MASSQTPFVLDLEDGKYGVVPASHPTVKKWRYDGLNVAVGIAKRYRDIYREAGTDESYDFARVAEFIMNDINGLLPVEERLNLD